MEQRKNSMAVIGAGPMGLAVAYHALKAGYNVTVYEADHVPGGMAAHFDFGGISIERFYHFVCKADKSTFRLLEELEMADTMTWVPTSMGYYINGKHYKWGNPIALLQFPLISFADKLRYAATVLLTTKKKTWENLENVSAKEWLTKTCGQKVYSLLWERLFYLKFFAFSDNISAAWMGTRIKRVGTSRRSIMQEELGYIQGGSQTLVDALCNAIQSMGGKIHLGQQIKRVHIDRGSNRVTGVETRDGIFPHDKVISTIPIPYINPIIPDLPQSWKDRFDAIRNIACVCVIVRLKQKISDHFWININDPAIDIPGIIEFSNLRNLGDKHVVYLPYYMPHDHPKFLWPDENFVAEAKRYLMQLNPSLVEGDFIDIKVGRLKYAQPICEPGFKAKIPPIQTPVTGLKIADTCYYYPEDRGISESVRLAREIVDEMIRETHQ